MNRIRDKARIASFGLPATESHDGETVLLRDHLWQILDEEADR